MLSTPDAKMPRYNGLTELTQGLSADAYFDAAPLRARAATHLVSQLDLRRPVERACGEAGIPHLRHRRSEACCWCATRRASARLPQYLPPSRRARCATRITARCGPASIVCPYHAWVYDLQGDLLRTSSKLQARRLRRGGLSAVQGRGARVERIHLRRLDGESAGVREIFDLPLNRLDAWRLGESRGRARLFKNIQCNWKIFWENYNECLHCPGVHPKLSQPRAHLRARPARGARRSGLERHAADADPKYKGGLREGAATWSFGRPVERGLRFPDSPRRTARLGHMYMTGLPSMFIVGHVDYVRVVRLRPLGPEQTELRVEYLFSPQTLADPNFDMQQHGRFHQPGDDRRCGDLRAQSARTARRAARRGVVMPEEYVIRQFHDWVDH